MYYEKLFVPIIIFLTVSLVSYAAIATTASVEKDSLPAQATDIALAAQLYKLGLFRGVGVNNDGTVNFALDRAPTRAEALVMLIRMLGKENLAEAYPKTHPFADVPDWADGYVSYAYDNGLTNGVTDTMFGSCDPVEAAMYMTFILRALGYADGEGKDFYWDFPWTLADESRIFPPQALNYDFSRGDAVKVTCSALFANLKGTDSTLYERLISESVFTEAQFHEAFTEDPFYNFGQIGKHIASYIDDHLINPVPAIKNVYPIEGHVILDISAPENDIIWAQAYVGAGAVTLGINNSIVSFDWLTELWSFELDAGTLQVKSDMTSIKISNAGLDLNDYFTGDVLDAQKSLFDGICMAGELKAQAQIRAGAIRYIPLTYEESLAEVSTSEFLRIIRTIESEQCTILLRVTGGVPHAGGIDMLMIFKPGSLVGEGVVSYAPLPLTNGWGMTDLEPDELYLSENGLTLYYSYHFDEEMVIEEHKYHEAGTYNYAIDLTTTETSIEIIP